MKKVYLVYRIVTVNYFLGEFNFDIFLKAFDSSEKARNFRNDNCSFNSKVVEIEVE
jgi:hypothetical protein